jgi:hypothetical protein
MSAEAVTYELRDNVAWLGLNRPRKRNAIDRRLLVALHESVARERSRCGQPLRIAPLITPYQRGRISERRTP